MSARKDAVVVGQWYWVLCAAYSPEPAPAQVCRETHGFGATAGTSLVLRGNFGLPNVDGSRRPDAADLPDGPKLRTPYRHGMHDSKRIPIEIVLLAPLKPPKVPARFLPREDE